MAFHGFAILIIGGTFILYLLSGVNQDIIVPPGLKELAFFLLGVYVTIVKTTMIDESPTTS